MPTSVRVIRVLNDEYTVECEVEVEDISELFNELTKTPWGRKVAHLLGEMLPDIPEYNPEDTKEQAEAEAKRIAEHEESLREEGYKKAIVEYGRKTKVEIETEAKKEVREKYLQYIRDKQGREKKHRPCFGTYYSRLDQFRDEGYGGMLKIAQLTRECNSCKEKADCMEKSKRGRDNGAETEG